MPDSLPALPEPSEVVVRILVAPEFLSKPAMAQNWILYTVQAFCFELLAVPVQHVTVFCRDLLAPWQGFPGDSGAMRPVRRGIAALAAIRGFCKHPIPSRTCRLAGNAAEPWAPGLRA